MGWPVVALGEVVAHRKQFIQIRDDESYQRCRVQLHAQGVVSRDRVLGADIKTKSQQVCRASEFLVAEIDAKHGGYGLVPSALDGAVVSSHYFLFSVHRDRMEPEFLGWFARSKQFFEQVAAQGSTNYSAVRPRQILDFEVPLPPLDEQRRIVARLDAVAARLAARAAAAERQEAELAAMLTQAFARITAGSPRARMADVAPLVRREVTIAPETLYTEIGIRSFFRGMFARRTMAGAEYTWQSLYRIEAGDVVFSNLMAWERGIALAGAEDAGRVGNHRMLTCAPDLQRLVPGFLFFYFTMREGFAQVEAASPGSIARNKTLSPQGLAAIEVPLPPLDAQRWFEGLRVKADALRALHATTAEDAAALLPAMLHDIFGGTGSAQPSNP
jgi:type I restriction enzyme S subunit